MDGPYLHEREGGTGKKTVRRNSKLAISDERSKNKLGLRRRQLIKTLDQDRSFGSPVNQGTEKQ